MCVCVCVAGGGGGGGLGKGWHPHYFLRWCALNQWRPFWFLIVSVKSGMRMMNEAASYSPHFCGKPLRKLSYTSYFMSPFLKNKFLQVLFKRPSSITGHTGKHVCYAEELRRGARRFKSNFWPISRGFLVGPIVDVA